MIKVHGQSGSTVPRSPGSSVLVPCGHGWIFVAAQVWHGMSQTLVPGHSSEQLAWWGQLEPCCIWVASAVGAGNVGCNAWCRWK